VPVASGLFGVDGQYDFVRATFTDGSNVPRMPPMRVGGGAYWRNDNWFVRMGLLHAFGQNDLGVNDTPTAGYNLLRMEISNRQYWQYSPWGPTEIVTGLTGDNLLHVDVRNSVQFHKDEILLPGRSVKFFMNAKFGGAPPPSKAPTGYYNAPVGFGAPIFKAPVATAWSWAGPYLGVNAGYAWGKSDTDTAISDAIAGTSLLATSTSGKFTGPMYGAQAGFNWQWGAFVAGIEGDVQNSRQGGRTSTFACAGTTCNPTPGTFGLDAPVSARMEQRLEWFGTLRGRLGVTPTAGSLFYATGGLAVGRIKTSGTISGAGLSFIEGVTEGVETGVDDDGNPIEIPVEIPTLTAGANPTTTTFFNQQTKAGWTVGAGAEVRLGGNWTGKIEYLYLDFGTVSTTATLPQNATPLAVTFNSRVTENLVRLGVNYKFDPLGAAYGPPETAIGPLVFKAPVRSAWSWAGLYLGGTIGYGGGTSHTGILFSDIASTSQLLATARANRLDGAIGGAQAGYNWVAGNLIAGVEADLNYSGQRAGFAATCPGEVCNPALIGVVGDPSVQAVFEQSQKLEWFATLRGRLGAIVTPGAVAYVTGGLTVGEVMTAGTVFGFDGDGNAVNTIVSSHNTKAGWAVGGGLEARLAGNWTGKLEYLYLDLGSITTVPTPAPGATVAAAFNSRVTDNVVRLGVNYKFDSNEIWRY
jgi:opacity protein-like surface antigen